MKQKLTNLISVFHTKRNLRNRDNFSKRTYDVGEIKSPCLKSVNSAFIDQEIQEIEE